jgi:RimJ/RimL family protein N-acetyltransferase
VSAAMIDRFERDFESEGFGLWALEIPGELQLAGFLGLARVHADLPCAPAVEIGWRLTPRAWGRGIAFEGAQAALDFAFQEVGLAEVVSFTAVGNVRSRRLMERLGMARDETADFDHPLIASGHPLARHVLYRRRRSPG